ncbi:hypothetical protein KAR91_71850, partial [Candidatus Pacearchaeota archaeon]|nr:hypothetical protein [Candidatus Pacearchaeota archaeon]
MTNKETTERPDHIKTSIEFDDWLKSQEIPPIKVDEFAPIIWLGDMGQFIVGARRDAIRDIQRVNEERGEFDCEG